MAHFAKLDFHNIVTKVVVISDTDCIDADGKENENVGINFCQNLFGGRWIQTSYNASFRKNYAGLGYRYDERLDAFVPPPTFLSWIFNENTCNWDPPIPYPDDDKDYYWDETTKEWKINE